MEMLALSIRQPWAYLIAHGFKDIENRNWPTKVRGKILIHASAGMTKDECRECFSHVQKILPSERVDILRAAGLSYPMLKKDQMGGFVGTVDIVDCVKESSSPWFFGSYGFTLANAKPFPLVPAKGRLGFFKVTDQAVFDWAETYGAL